MSITCTVTPGHTYGANHTVDYGDLNKLGTPGVSVPDGGTLAFGVGTALLPSISILGDPNTGFYQPTVDQLAFSAGGAQALLFSAGGLTGNVQLPAGASATPSLAFSTDTDTGIYLAAANTIGVAGTLAIADGNAAAPALTFATDLDTGLALTAANTMVATCGGSTVATFSATGIDAVGLSISGVAVAPAGLDFGKARFFDDFHNMEESGWLWYALNGGEIGPLRGGGNAASMAEGCVTLHVTSSTGSIACALWPHSPNVYGTASLTAAKSGLTQFDTTGEYVEFGFTLLDSLGSGTTAIMRLGIGAISSAEYSAPAGTGINDYVGIQYSYQSGLNLGLVIDSVVQPSTTLAALNTYYRARITRTAAGYTLHVNGELVATKTGVTTLSAPGRIMMLLYYPLGGTSTWPVVQVDYVQWEKPITRS